MENLTQPQNAPMVAYDYARMADLYDLFCTIDGADAPAALPTGDRQAGTEPVRGEVARDRP